ncbi:MAG: neutral/alkaline non-lysosomal ceramidase N-terminal domain-containing protein [Tepidisphaeraceae bacterium]
MHVGAAAADITPDFEVELCGFALRQQPSTGVLDPIFARCVYLDDESHNRLLWIVADVVALDRALVDDFRAWAKSEFGLRPEQVMLAATHTHAAPTTVTLNAAGARSEPFAQLLRERMEQIAREAVRNARPCDVVTAAGRIDLAIDRRNKPTKHVDPTVWSIAFRERGGGPSTPHGTGRFVAAILNYAMHPVALGYEERRISPDWCGGASASLAQALTTNDATTTPVVLTTNGAAGNVNPPFHGASRDQVFGWGKSVAHVVAETLREATPRQDVTLAVRSTTVAMPLESHDARGIDRIADHMIRDVAPTTTWPDQFTRAVTAWRDALTSQVASGGGREHDIELQAARIGDVTVVAVNGEMFARFTDDLRRATGDDRLFVVGYANAAFGYIPTREAYAEGGYETDTAHFFYNSFRPLPGSLEMLCDRAAELVRSL